MATPSSTVTENDIERAIDEYLSKVPSLWSRVVQGPTPFGENYKFNIFGQQPYLLIAKFKLEKLPKRILKRLSVHLVKQFAVQVELDSKWYWALTHDIGKSVAGRQILRQWDLGSLFNTLIAAHLASLNYSYNDVVAQRLNKVIDNALPEPTKQLVFSTRDILEYLCYPILESLVKFVLSSVVDSNGNVLATSISDGRQQYGRGARISRLGVLLRCLETNATSMLNNPNLGSDLGDFRTETERIIPPSASEDGWDQIYKLRIVTAHGVTRPEFRSGLITNLICLILWHLFDDSLIDQELQNIERRPRFFFFERYFYPPIW